MTNVVALVPLRGGSKGIPFKNIKLIAGKPLCAWVLAAAHASGIFSRIVVSTDSEEIAQVVRSLGLAVEVLMRPAELATDIASTESVMLHIAQQIDFEILVTIQATSPLVRPEDFQNAFKQFELEKFDSLLSGVHIDRYFWTNDGIPLNYDPQHRPRRQDFSGSIMENGAFYFTRREILLSKQCRLGGKIGVYEMSDESAVEIDEPSDWVKVERLLHSQLNCPDSLVFSKIRLLVVDVDGTLTDAGMYYSAEGEVLKKFNTRDAKGLSLVRKSGVDVAIMTSEDSPIVKARAKKLMIDHCFTGIADKMSELLKLCASLGVSIDEVAYIGDDINDLQCIKAVGYSACPADAVQQIKTQSHYISVYKGGDGAVRDICDRIIEARR